jgi:hypothetical protein
VSDFDLEEAIQQSVRVSDALQLILSTEAHVDIRGRFAIAYLSLSLDHREAILLLVDRGAFASATALQRPLLEAFVTGAWISDAATDEELLPIMSLKRPPPKFETMTQRLRKTHDLGRWFEIFRNQYDILGDYAHGHRRQVSRWITSGAVEPKYGSGQMVETLRYVNLIGVMAAIHREKIACRPITQLLQMMEAIIDRRECPMPD